MISAAYDTTQRKINIWGFSLQSKLEKFRMFLSKESWFGEEEVCEPMSNFSTGTLCDIVFSFNSC